MNFQIDKVKIYDPRLDFGNGKRPWVIVKGAEQNRYTNYPADSFSNSNSSFTIRPNGKSTVVDRTMLKRLRVKLTFTGTQNGNNPLLKAGTDAFRYMPISSITESVQMKINGYGINCQLKDIIHPMTRYHVNGDFYDGINSVSPNMMDYYGEYYQGDSSVNNSLSTYKDNTLQVPRGGYIIEKCEQATAAAPATTLTTEVIADLYEYIYLPPCIWNGDAAPGLVGIDTLSFLFNYTNLARMWSRSISNGIAGGVYTERLTNLVVSIESAEMYVNWLSPPITQPIPRLVQYPYFEITRFNTSNTGTTIAPSSPTKLTLTSSQISLNSIPKKMYIYACMPDGLLSNGSLGGFSSFGAVYTSNTYLRINKLQVNWGNQNALFSGSNIVNHYQMSVRNGLKMGFIEYGGRSTNFPENLAPAGAGLKIDAFEKVSTVGSVICIDCSQDLPLMANEAEGMLTQKQLQVIVEVENTLPDYTALGGGLQGFYTFAPDLNIICVFDGVLEIYDNSCRTMIGVINEDDVINTPIDNSIDYNVLSRVYGGTALERFKNLSSKAINAVRKGNQYLKDTQALSKGFDALGKKDIAARLDKRGYGRKGGVLYERSYGSGKVPKSKLSEILEDY